jgi:signal transduction histidine kinase/CheY-like chemotaxis protein
MNELDRGTRIYILATMGAALAVGFTVFPNAPLDLGSQFLTLALIGAIMAPHSVHLGLRVEMSISHPFILATMILIGEAEAVLLAAICISSLCLFRKPRMALFRALFNVSSFVVTTFLACETYLAFGGDRVDAGLETILVALMLATLVFYLGNTYSIAGVVALANRLNVFRAWHENFLWSAPSFLAGGSLALGMAYFLDRFGLYAFVLSLPFCVLIYYSYKLYLDKLEEKRQHIEDIQEMNAGLERKVRERTLELEIVNEKLQESNLELKRASSMKSEFLANMSHELRTPLNAIIGFSELLLDPGFGGLGEDQKSHVEDILGSGRHLLDLINDILDLSKIEAGKMHLNRECFDMAPAVDEAMALLRIEAGKKQIDLTSRVDGESAGILADRSKVKQVMYNLLSNAVKFTPAGGRVSVTVVREEGLLSVSVADTGIGIGAEDQERIFQAFTQVDGSYARQYQGTGLGLALVKKFIEMHGGQVKLTSTINVGSTFSFRIPLLQPPGSRDPVPRPAAPIDADAPPSTGDAIVVPDDGAGDAIAVPSDGEGNSDGGELGAGARTSKGEEHRDETIPRPDDTGELIMVVEDNPSSMRLFASLLRSAGYRVVEKTSGEEALDALRSLIPRLILMDIQLPGMDGLTVARSLRDDPERSRIPIVALTAHAMQGDEYRAREAGCSGYITKPIESARFPTQIAAFLKNAADGR